MNTISRRTILRSLGASVALPWLESPNSFATEPQKPQQIGPPRRFACLFMGDGVRPADWHFSGQGKDMKLGPAFPSLEDIKQKLIFIDGLRHPHTGSHAKGAAAILSDGKPQPGRDIRCGTTFDQVLARTIGRQSLLPSMTLTLERPVSGFHESQYSMAYASYLSWRTPSQPVSPEIYPALAFDSLYSSRASRMQLSVIDHVHDQLKAINKEISYADRHRLDQYTQSVREVEQELHRLESKGNTERQVEAMPRPQDALPDTLDQHANLMLDILALAFQTDRSRVATLVFANNLSGQQYRFLGYDGDHHAHSHHSNSPKWGAITRYWVSKYSYFIQKLDTMNEGERTVLDNSCIVMANEQWRAHMNTKIPYIMAGSLGGHFTTGRCLQYEHKGKNNYTHVARSYLNIAKGMGLPMRRFGSQSEALAEL